MFLIFFFRGLIALVSLCILSAATVDAAGLCDRCDSTATIIARLAPPEGYKRVPTEPGSWESWLRNRLLLPRSSDAKDWRGNIAFTADEVAGVLDWRLLGRIEQCADISLRLLAEFAWESNNRDRISFRSLSGQHIGWKQWTQGRYSVNADGTRITYNTAARHSPDSTRASFDRFLVFVMSYVNTASLLRD